MIQHGFPPLFNADSTVLILGSFPSVKSREQQFYYGHPQNRFWKTLCEAFNANVTTVDDKRHLCLSHGIALWDIVVSCEIDGSLDANIRNYQTANLSEVLSHCNITKILCNGTKAYQLTTATYKGPVPVIKLPSTSPLNTRFDKSLWLQQLTRR